MDKDKNRKWREVVIVWEDGEWGMISFENECSDGCEDIQKVTGVRKLLSGSHEL